MRFDLRFEAGRELFALFVLVAVILGLLIGKILTVVEQPRCADLGDEWHTWRGCKVTNAKGAVRWIGRP